MKHLFYLLVLVTLSSCLTVNRIQRNCDKFAKICVTDTKTWIEYRDTTIYRTDTIRIQLPADTVNITDTVRIVNNLAYLPPVHKEFGLIGVDASVQHSILNVSAYLVDSTILHTRSDTIIIEKAIREEKETNLVPVKYIPSFYKFTFWLFWIAVLAGLAFLFFKFRQPINRTVLSVFQRKEDI